MSVNLRGLHTHRVVDFSGGLNENASSFTMQDSELQEATNVTLIRTGGAMRTRKGMPIYQRQSFLSINSPIRDAWHYSKFNGSRRVVAHAGGTIYVDDDNGEFFQVQAGIPSGDGHLRMTQWRESVILGNEYVIYVYDPAGIPTPLSALNLSGTNTWGAPTIGLYLTGISGNNAGGIFAPGDVYSYRYTLDLYCGNTFLGETAPENVINSTTGVRQEWITWDVTIAAGKNSVEFRVWPSATALDAFWGATVGAINIYRKILPGSAPSSQIEPNMVWVGAIPRSEFGTTGAAPALAQLVDLGLFAGRSIAPYYSRALPPPRGRFPAIHKSRLWSAFVNWPSLPPSGSTVLYTASPHRVYFSEINEIGAFIPTSWVEIDPTHGDGITGIISYKNKILIVFQANSIWAISGGDQEIGPGIPDLSIENISTDIGCVAPESIRICEGRVIWLSHRGVYYYDGTIPRPMKSEWIDATLLARPSSRYNAPCAAFLSGDREYWLAHTPPGGDSQTIISKFNFTSGSWVRADAGIGISVFFEKKYSLYPAEMYATVENTSISTSAINRVEYGGYDLSATTPAAIAWSWQTRFYDMRSPMMDKKFVAVLVQLESETDVTMQVSCDNHLVNEPFTILKTENDQDIAGDDFIWANDAGTIGSNWSDGVTGTEWTGDKIRNALIYLNTKCWGKRIALRFSGQSTADATEIQALTFFYDQKEGVRQ